MLSNFPIGYLKLAKNGKEPIYKQFGDDTIKLPKRS